MKRLFQGVLRNKGTGGGNNWFSVWNFVKKHMRTALSRLIFVITDIVMTRPVNLFLLPNLSESGLDKKSLGVLNKGTWGEDE